MQANTIIFGTTGRETMLVAYEALGYLPKKATYYINPNYDTVRNEVLPNEFALAVYENTIPDIMDRFIDIDNKAYGNFCVFNPIVEYPNTVWTIQAWYSPYMKKLNLVYPIKLNKKAMTSMFTYCDLFYCKTRPNILVEFGKDDMLDGTCKGCEAFYHCKYRWHIGYRKYHDCHTYAAIEEENISRLVDMFDEAKISVDNEDRCTKEIKRKLYATFI
jgi:hypothetical protein